MVASALFSSKNFTIRSRPRDAAQCKGVHPVESTSFTLRTEPGHKLGEMGTEAII